jgi:hypothetical protein
MALESIQADPGNLTQSVQGVTSPSQGLGDREMAREDSLAAGVATDVSSGGRTAHAAVSPTENGRTIDLDEEAHDLGNFYCPQVTVCMPIKLNLNHVLTSLYLMSFKLY